jgi:thiamine biosynthesis protein ThiS
MNELTVIVNGASRQVPAPATARRLLEHLELDPRGVVVEINQRIIRRPQLDDAHLAEGDRIEIVHFVGGG